MIWSNPISLFVIMMVSMLSIPTIAQGNEEGIVLEIRQASFAPYEGPAEQPRTLTLELALKPDFKAYLDKFDVHILEPYPTQQSQLKLTPVLEFYDKFSKSNRKGIKESGTLSTEVEIQQPLKPGLHKLEFELAFQACSETVCYFPQKIKSEVEFMVVSSENQTGKQKSTSLLEENFTAAKERGLPYLFFFVFLAGVLTSLTPCLLPILPLTIAVIGKGHSHDAKLKKFFNALSYVLGIATTYSLLGVLAATSGALFGNILSNLWVQVGFGLAFILMGLAQFGFFEFQTPLWLQNRFHRLSSGIGGIYVTGLLSGFIASPCVGPVLVGILTFIAQTQDRILGFWLMFAYALGLGQLLIVLGVFSSLLYRFPRSPWLMKASKIILGFALIASGLFYLSLVWPTTKAVYKGPVENQHSMHSLPWKAYSEDILRTAASEGKPVMIDFFADWCLACHELEQKTFSDPAVQEALKDFVLLRFDATEDSATLNTLKERYKIVGLPTLIFYDKTGKWRSEFTLNEFEDSASFLKRLEQIGLSGSEKLSE